VHGPDSEIVATWCLLHHAQNPKDNYYDHYGQDEPDDTAHLIIPSEADSDNVSQPMINKNNL